MYPDISDICDTNVKYVSVISVTLSNSNQQCDRAGCASNGKVLAGCSLGFCQIERLKSFNPYKNPSEPSPDH